jgi:hypothetical protein
MTESSLLQAWRDLPIDAPEAVVSANFAAPPLFDALGFNQRERLPEFQTGIGGKAVDFAARHNIHEDIFLENKSNPYLLVELKVEMSIWLLHLLNIYRQSDSYMVI